jgi:hypothetical protein
MADVFLSYARPDTHKAALIAHLLQQAGYSVWQDTRDIAPGDSWTRQIKHEIEAARVIVVLWSHASITSVWVNDEASYGAKLNKLIPLLLEDVEIPLGFRGYHHAVLTDWHGDLNHSGLRAVLRAISALTGRTAFSTARPDDPGKALPLSHREYDKPVRASRWSIFIAHASSDKPRLKGILTVLAEAGFSLWIDKPELIGLDREVERRVGQARIRTGDDWQASIRQAVNKADIVLAFWSRDAIEGKREQFHYEVYQGLVQGKLTQCKIDNISQDTIGFPFTFHQIADLSDYVENNFHVGLNYLVLDIAHIAERSGKWRWFR